MTHKPAYIKGLHPDSFRKGESAEIVGVRYCCVSAYWRLCYVVCFSDGVVDYIPFSEANNLELYFISQRDGMK